MPTRSSAPSCPGSHLPTPPSTTPVISPPCGPSTLNVPSMSTSPPQPDPPPSNPTVQSMDTQFEPLDIIGTGSFGIIRKVRRLHDGLILARKELNYGRMDERDLRQLGEEVNILQNLRGNDHIVKYFERYVDKQNFMLYILMEYCSQGDLAGVISRCRRDQVHLAEDTIWSYLAQISTALLDCHSADLSPEDGTKKKPIILHRDIKPENVFLNHFGLVKLGDFGLSKAMEMAAFTNTYVGTPYYMSPELINGQQYDVKSDIWALGCLMYELCAWHPPFHQAQTQPELAKLIREGKIPNLPRGYSSQLTALIKSMLRQDPKLRPDTKAILSVEQVKHQIRVLEVHRYARELTKKQTLIEEQEKSLLEREAKLKSREAKLQKEKEYFKSQQENHLLLQEEFQVKFQHALEVIERANQIEARQQVENLTPQQTTDDIPPPSSLSSRRGPLSERRYSFNPPVASAPASTSTTPTINYVQSKRLSALQAPDITTYPISQGSPMKLDTPFKHLQAASEPPPPPPPLPTHTQGLPSNAQGTMGSRIVRQVKSSKSLASLKSAPGFLTRLKSSGESDSITTTSDDGPSHTPAVSVQTQPKKGGGTTTFSSRRLSRRSESANGLLLGHQHDQSSKRPPTIHDSPPAECDLAPSRPSARPSSDGSSLRSPSYNHHDLDSLPSPFLKKKSSASTLVSNFLRPHSVQNPPISAPMSPRKLSAPSAGREPRKLPTMFQNIKNGGGAPPSIAARPSVATKRSSIASSNLAKPSLTSKFLGVAESKKLAGGRKREQSNPTH